MEVSRGARLLEDIRCHAKRPYEEKTPPFFNARNSPPNTVRKRRIYCKRVSFRTHCVGHVVDEDCSLARHIPVENEPKTATKHTKVRAPHCPLTTPREKGQADWSLVGQATTLLGPGPESGTCSRIGCSSSSRGWLGLITRRAPSSRRYSPSYVSSSTAQALQKTTLFFSAIFGSLCLSRACLGK